MAKLNRASFVSKWATLFADNVTKDISEQDLRDFRQDIADSLWFQLDDPLDEYWPLGGTPTLTDNFALDGDGNDFEIANTGLINLESTGTITLQSDASISGVSSGTIHFTADDGVDSSDFTLQPDLFSLSITGDVDLVSDNFSVARATGMSVLADDGVDSSTFSLTPTSFDINITGGGSSFITGPIDLTLGSDGFYGSNLNSFVLNVDNQIQILGAGETKITGEEIVLISNLGVRLPSFTVATLPVTAQAGLFAFCEDESGGEVPVFTDNSGNWRRVTDGNIAA